MNKRSVLWIWLAIVLMAMFFSWQTTSASAQTQQPDKPLADVVVKAENGKLAIYVQRMDDLNQQLVATVPFNKAPVLLSDFVSLSPDGGRVTYVTMDDPYTRENAVLWIARADGSGTEAIARFAQGYWLAAPQWSPDGQQLAFVKEIEATDPQQRLELWTMRANGSDQRLVLRGGVLRPEIFANSSRPLTWTDDGASLRLDDQTVSPPLAYTFSVTGNGLVTAEETIKDPVLAAQAEETRANLPCAVQLWHQNDYGQIMQTCNRSISSAGCALTSTAMVFKYYGVNTDPPTLNSCLGNQACDLYWDVAASRCSESKVAWTGRSDSVNYDTIQQDLSAGKPVIVKLSKGNNTHFVVVTAGSGQSPNGYSINDPSRYNPLRQSLAPYITEGWSPSGMRRYSGTPACSDGDGGNISYGQSRNGTINPAGDTDDFYFDASAGDVVEIRQNKASGSNLDSYLQLYNPSNTLIASDDDSGGNYNSFIRRTLDSGGRYRIRAMAYPYGSSTGAYTLSLQRVTSGGGGGCGGDCEGDPRWIAINQTLNGTISPNNDRDTYFFSGTAGRVVSIRMNKTGGALDPYLELWSPAGVRVAFNDDGGGFPNSWIVYTLPASGTYRISAYSYNNASSGTYSLRLESTTGGGSSGNLARGKPVAVSSVEFSGVEGWKATDGNLGTRWSSRFSDPQWIYVDLGQARYFNQVVLKWETAYGRSFGIYYWTGSVWRNLYWTDSGRGGTNTINLNRTLARYVMMFGAQRGTQWGYSLWEFEIYDTTTTTVPLVPPDDPAKEPNSAPLQLPLAPVEGDKEVTLDGEGALGQEYSPLPGGNPEPAPEERQDVQTVVAFIRSPDLDELYKLYTPAWHIRFTGEASSQGPAGPLAITAYEWRSDRNGIIGTEAEFILPVTELSPGLHTITLRAQNELGAWSEEVSMTLEVNWPYRIFLPALLR